MNYEIPAIFTSEVSFELLSTDHFPLLHQWVQKPHVRQCSRSLDEIKEKYSPVERGAKKSIDSFIVKFQGKPIGFIQLYDALNFSREGFGLQGFCNQSQAVAALDFYIGDPAYIGKEPEVLRLFLQNHVFKQYDVCLVDLEKKDKTALRAYAKAGFSTVKELSSKVIMATEKIERRNPIVVYGSSRSEGGTLQAVKAVIKDPAIPIIDLRKLNISQYDYNYENEHDDFIALAEKMIQHQPIILATPVYWYAMSALMKTFIDRFSDLLDIRKDIGRRLSGKELFVIASYGTSLPKGFEDAFSQTCDYLDMQYKSCFYFYSGKDPELAKDNELSVKQFSDQIFL